MNTPTLTDERVAAMRSSVMRTVDHDVARRGRRLRRTVGLAAASVLVLGTGTLGLSLLDTGGGSDAGDRAILGGAAAERDSSSSGAEDSAGGTATGGDAEVDPDREIVTTGEITVLVKDPRAAAQKVSAFAESVGGRVDSRNESGNGDDASAIVTIRVPSAKVTATIDRLATYGSVEDVSLQNDDVTAQAQDLDARIDALRLSIARLEKIMSGSTTSTELIKAEGALTQRQEQLESLEAQRKQIADQVSLSTLSIDLSQRARPDSVDPGGFTGGLANGWNALVSTVNTVVEVVGALLPWAAIALALHLVHRLVTRRRRHD